MKHYELIFLVTSKIPETDLDPIQVQITELISGIGGNITKAESMGRRKLAYPIEGDRYGFYFVSEFDAEPARLREITKKLELNKSLLRHLLVTKKPVSAKEMLAQEAAQRRAHQRANRVAEKQDTTQRTSEEEAKTKKDDKKIKLEELDKKLDELLDQDIVT